MNRVLYDTDVQLDVLQARRPHRAASSAALGLVETGRVEGYLAAHAVTTLAFLLRRQVGAARSRAIVADLLVWLRIASVTERPVRTSLVGQFSDVEDAVCHAAALEADAEVIVTRNLADFAAGTVPAVLPEMLLVTPASRPRARRRRDERPGL